MNDCTRSVIDKMYLIEYLELLVGLLISDNIRDERVLLLLHISD